MEEKNKNEPVSGVNHHVQISTDSELTSALKGRWPDRDMAFLVVHGIGNQKPLETLDVFARGLIKALAEYGEHADNVSFSHEVVSKTSDDATYFWFDNFIRIKKTGCKHVIDIYEYYWANHTEDKTDFNKIFQWLRKVTDGAKHFYVPNKELSNKVSDSSIFVNPKTGFNHRTYKFVIYGLGSLVVVISGIKKGLLWLLKLLPFVGSLTAEFLERKSENSILEAANVIGDITIYNEINPRAETYKIRKDILNGAVKAIRFLVEPDKNGELMYGRVVVAGHSLGSQIAFDAINRVTHQVNLSELNGYDSKGYFTSGSKQLSTPGDNKVHISEILDKFITFGSPLDKIAFFLREQCEESEYLRIQMLKNFHCFKQRDWTYSNGFQKKMGNSFKRQFDNITWCNYYHGKDYVSGSLDFYHSLTNVNCEFPNNTFGFTHSNYWNSTRFFGDVLRHVI